MVALPKGRMAEQAVDLMARAGISEPRDDMGRKLVIESVDGSLRYIMANPSDVPTYVEYGAVDVGICGLDTLRESSRELVFVVVRGPWASASSAASSSAASWPSLAFARRRSACSQGYICS